MCLKMGKGGHAAFGSARFSLEFLSQSRRKWEKMTRAEQATVEAARAARCRRNRACRHGIRAGRAGAWLERRPDRDGKHNGGPSSPSDHRGCGPAPAGGLISYGPDRLDQYRRAAGYVDRILKGEKPADLLVQAPTKYASTIGSPALAKRRL
jgi:hypothetical protein